MSSRRSSIQSTGGGASRKLRLDNNTMDVEEIIEVLIEAKEQPQWNVLTFDEVIFDSTMVAATVDLLRSYGRTWERLNLEFCEGSVDVIVQAAMVLDCVKHIFLASDDDDDAQQQLLITFSTLLRINTALTSLWLLVTLTESATTALGQALAINQTLQKLSLSGCNWEPMAPHALAQSGLANNTSLRTIDWSCCFLHDDELAILLQALVGHPTLEIIDLSRNVARSHTTHTLAHILQQDDTKLLTIDLREQNVTPQDDQQQQQQQQQQSSSSSNSLDISLLAQSLQNNDMLQTLKLSNNALTDQQIMELANGLKGNSSIQHLDLQWNHITERGLNVFTEVLPHISSLEVLLLGGNAFGLEGFNLLENLPNDDESICTVKDNSLQQQQNRFRDSWGEEYFSSNLLS